jgi:glycosyltransferase involved in cell wall biosynthesis
MANLTLMFATYNGAATLPRLLESLARQEPPTGGWKIVAVDNGGPAAGAPILREWSARLPLTIVTETRRGKNTALNTGLREVEGDLVVLTDDDVVAPANWLVSLQALAEAQPDYDIFGGAIEPIWPFDPPEWVLRCAPTNSFAWTQFDEGPVSPSLVWGPNMAVRRKVLEGRRFREDLGPDGTENCALGDETEFFMRAVEAGHRCWHAPDIVVGHIVEPHQLTEKWLLQRAYNHARGVRRIMRSRRNAAWRAAGLSRALGSYGLAQVTSLTARLFGGFEARFKAALALSRIEGDLEERMSPMRRDTELRREGPLG